MSQRLDYGLEARIEGEEWGSASTPEFARYEITPEILWHYSPRYDFTLGYQHSETFRANESSLEGDTAIIAAKVKVPFAGESWMLTSRQQFQFGTGDPAYANVFRHQVMLQYRGFLEKRLQPFIANEYFLNFSGGGITENRASIGVGYELNKATSIELYFMRVDTWMPNQGNVFIPVIGLNLNLHF